MTHQLRKFPYLLAIFCALFCTALAPLHASEGVSLPQAKRYFFSLPKGIAYNLTPEQPEEGITPRFDLKIAWDGGFSFVYAVSQNQQVWMSSLCGKAALSAGYEKVGECFADQRPIEAILTIDFDDDKEAGRRKEVLKQNIRYLNELGKHKKVTLRFYLLPVKSGYTIFNEEKQSQFKEKLYQYLQAIDVLDLEVVHACFLSLRKGVFYENVCLFGVEDFELKLQEAGFVWNMNIMQRLFTTHSHTLTEQDTSQWHTKSPPVLFVLGLMAFIVSKKYLGQNPAPPTSLQPTPQTLDAGGIDSKLKG
ncbi:MAG: hypothetical protein ACPGC9_01220 [Cytophagales bacterium]